MLILWISNLRKGKQSDDNPIEKQPFSDHDEDMKRFKELHQELQTVTNRDIMTTDGSVLAPVHGVRLAKNSQN
jgi:hypothetical protein